MEAEVTNEIRPDAACCERNERKDDEQNDSTGDEPKEECIDGEPEEEARSQKRLVSMLTLVFALTGLGILLIPFIDIDVGIRISREDGLMENIQALLFIAAGCLWFCVLLKSRDVGGIARRKQILYFILGMVMLLFFFEEISWGQRMFGYSTPESLAGINLQGESNIHNIGFFGSGETPYAMIATAIVIIAVCIILVGKRYANMKGTMDRILIPLGQYDLVALLILSLSFASYPAPPPSYWLIAIPFLCPVIAWASGKFKTFFEHFSAPGFQFSIVALTAILILALNFNPATEPNLRHNIAFETRETVLALALLCYPIFEARSFRQMIERG